MVDVEVEVGADHHVTIIDVLIRACYLTFAQWSVEEVYSDPVSMVFG